MDLWIRSQDREFLFKVDNVYVYKECVKYEENHSGTIYNLGIYKTTERALEVLEEIQNALLNRWANNVIYENCYDNERPRNLVYQMPKE